MAQDVGTPTLTRDQGGRFKGSLGLTEKQRAFVTAYVANGGVGTTAAEAAGYADTRATAWHLMQLPHVVAAIQMERQRLITAEGGTLAWATLKAIMTDQQAPAGVRVDAAKFTLRLAGHAEAKPATPDQGDKPLEDMSPAELEEFIAKANQRLVEEGRLLDISPTISDTATPESGGNPGDSTV